jgi:hypothetical protein
VGSHELEELSSPPLDGKSFGDDGESRRKNSLQTAPALAERQRAKTVTIEP